jgi:hypothetical protein
MSLILASLSGVSFAAGNDNYVVSTSHILYVTKSENIRAFVEPGTILKRQQIPIEDTYKRRIRVITPGGLEGEISRWGYDEHADITQIIGYLKRPITIKNEQFESGDPFLVKELDDEDGLKYEVTYPQPFLSLKDNAFYVRARKKVMTEEEFAYNFNLVLPGNVSTKFPLWIQSNESTAEWGCEKSKREVSVVEMGAGANISASAGFFNFFEADAEAYGNNKKTITYTKNLEDKINKHKITYWRLQPSRSSSAYILNLALEKLSSCDETKKLAFNYVIHFPKNKNIDPIAINQDWVSAKKLTPGGASPIKLSTLDDYREFKTAFQDFKFDFDLQGYELRTAILHYVIMMTANISVEYDGQ